MARFAVLVSGAFAALGTAGCAAKPLPDPRATASEFAAAVARGDARSVHALLTESAERGVGVEETRKALADARAEIVEEARAAASPQAVVHVVVEVPYVDGETALLDVEGGHVKISSSVGFPAEPRTPEQALAVLRGALARRSYAAFVRVLSTETRGTLENDMRTLVSGLQHPEALDVKVHGETAEVGVPGGHKVVLKREAGVWRIQDFD